MQHQVCLKEITKFAIRLRKHVNVGYCAFSVCVGNSIGHGKVQAITLLQVLPLLHWHGAGFQSWPTCEVDHKLWHTREHWYARFLTSTCSFFTAAAGQ